jgi:hypothetical protein
MKRSASGKKKPSICIESIDAPFTLLGKRKQSRSALNPSENAFP